jgi:diketogulonate reductase-like aldo/keto reductase
MNDYVITNSNIKMPKIIYGTAWKKELTNQYVYNALESGFKGIDTACQPKHYNEKGVGEGFSNFLKNSKNRKDFFLQTKFTPLRGQDPKTTPYDKDAKLQEQAKQSLEVSLENLQTDYIDSLVLHSPPESWDQLFEIWETFESFVQQKKVLQIGISNCYQPEVLKVLYKESKIKPSVVQNRFYQETNYDYDLRKFCNSNNIFYQSFWTLTANPQLLKHPLIINMSNNKNVTSAQLFFLYLSNLNIIPLTGTTSTLHMNQDLEILSMTLSSKEISQLNEITSFV